ncbi:MULTISPECIES: hypothetical protein [Actinosynnema]|uniref:PE domain-containing protein n=2 Tax=Actinosynnema TaxID=40566 RepID=C6WHS6_ACTMD|nr:MULTISPECIES: hypothetical protein [Actinosynnema]ACU40025.1 hypothetical protein Amir_6220 [Actinosynnema mirum DSM 43827]ATE57110.1 hypothetical protein CNX65_30625 [Actinosynnema pretiosum]AXX33550.1 hypothetical protein APASM_6185 [Actinosynnema pretiosum subsp. pretiosum]
MYIDEAGTDNQAQQPVAPKKRVPLGEEVVALNETVNSGKVSLDPVVGEELRKMLLEQIDQVDSWLERAGRLARPAPLGTNPVSERMKSKFEERAEGDPYSFASVMTSYREVLQQTHDSVQSAIRNFQAIDEEHRDELRRLSGAANLNSN